MGSHFHRRREVLEDPELVTLIPEEEDPPPPITEELSVIRELVVDVAVLIGLKVLMVFATRKLARTVKKLDKLNIPTQRNWK